MGQGLLRRLLEVALAATVGVLIGAGVANASPLWYSHGKRLGEGAVVPVTTRGVLTLAVLHTGPSFEVTCHVRDRETVTNPVGGSAGTGEVTEFSLSKCVATNVPCPEGRSAELIAHKLPWLTHLLQEPPGPIKDVIEGIGLELTCNGETPSFRDPFSGTLTPTVTGSVLEFGAESGQLRDPANREATITGTDKLKGPRSDEGERATPITARDPSHEEELEELRAEQEEQHED
jgi:hypothetical protein